MNEMQIPGVANLGDDALRNRHLLEKAPIPFFAVGPDGVLRWSNQAFRSTIPAAIGSNLMDVVHPEDLVFAAAQIGGILDGATDLSLPLRTRDLDGNELAVAAWFQAMLGPTGELAEIHGSFEIGTQDQARKDLDARIRYAATHDALTGLPNRQALTNRLELGVGAGPTKSVAVLFIDLNDFKQINDQHGHAFGDIVLREVAARIQSAIREDDVAGRYGGDEFLVVSSGSIDEADAVHLAHRIVEAVQQPMSVGDVGITPLVSVGVSVSHAGAESVQRLLIDADLSMYEAKRTRAPVVLVGEELRRQSARNGAIARDLKAALLGGDLLFHHQPIRRLSTGELRGTEALLRWEHPELGFIPPPEIIAHVEQSGLLEQFTEWSLRQAAEDVLRFRSSAPQFKHQRVALNLSPRQLSWRGYPELHATVLRESGIHPNDIVIEVTELGQIDVGVGTETTINELADMGVQIALDDFGVGFNALSYFTRIPVHALKIDRSLIAAAPNEVPAGAIVRSLVGLATSLELALVAEGIETAEEAQFCIEAGVEFGQGYLLGRPMPLDDLMRIEAFATPWSENDAESTSSSGLFV